MSEPTLAAGAAAGAEEVISETTAPVDSPPTATEGGSSDGFNPAWKTMLDKLPPEFHNMIKPDLQGWDKNFETKTQEVQSRYEPYAEFADNEVSPESIQQGLQLAAMLEADPRAFYEKMGEFYKDQWGQGPEEEANSDEEFSLDGAEEFDITKHPQFVKLAGNQEVLTNYLAQQIQEQQAAEAEKEIDAELTQLKEKHGDLDEEFMFAYAMQNDVGLDKAAEKWVEKRDNIRAMPRANDGAPQVVSPGGGLPSSQPAPGTMTDQQTRALVADIVRRANEQG